MTGRIRDLVRACRIYSDWLILQRVTRSENSAYSSSVKRVLITRRRWGVLYLFIGFNSFLFMVCPLTNRRKTGGKAEVFFEKSEKIFRGFFKRHKPQKGGLGVATPTRFPQDKIERLAKFGTVVESCSKKVAASAVWASADTLDGEGGGSGNFAAVFRSQYL